MDNCQDISAEAVALIRQPLRAEIDRLREALGDADRELLALRDHCEDRGDIAGANTCNQLGMRLRAALAATAPAPASDGAAWKAEASRFATALSALVDAVQPAYYDGYHCHACKEKYPAMEPDEIEHDEGCAYEAARRELSRVPPAPCAESEKGASDGD